MKWTEEDINTLVDMRNEGISMSTISEVLGRPYSSVVTRASRLIKDGVLVSRKPRLTEREIILLSDSNYLIELVKTYVSSEAAPGQVRTRVIKTFGTWTKALEVAGVSGNIGGKFCEDRIARVYLLRFEGFYKIGVTQQQIKSRFSGAPSYEILDYLETDLDNAVYLEKELKKSVKSYQYVAEHPWFERNGKTECFKTDRPIRQLEDIFDL